jgi:mono/diheme cytochrome c family protein
LTTFLRVPRVLRGGAFAIAVLLYGYVGLGAVYPAQTAAARSTQPSAPSPQPSPGPEPSALGPQRKLLDTYCIGCHNQRAKTANVMFDAMDLAHLSDQAEVWEKAVRKLRGGMMPPPGVRRPDQASVNGLVSWLEDSLDQAAAANPNPGRVALHRLNRAEYANAIEDLLGLHIDAGAFLPRDDEADGFDNVATVLKVSPSFLDQYISAARVVSTRALGNPSPRPGSATYRPPRGTDQGVHVDGLPLGTRGGLQVEHLFPSDGEYKLNVGGLATAGYVRGMEYRHTLVATIDGARVFEAQIGGEEDLKAIDQQQAPAVAAINGRFQNIPVKVTAGPHKVGVTFIARSYAESDEVLHSFRPGLGEERIPRVGSLEVVGPFNPAGVGETPSRRRIFVCSPGSAGDELPCATKVFSTFARRAFRRPVTDHDLEAPLGFYRTARETGDFDAGIRAGLTAILASPKFLFRAEQLPENVAPGSIYRISDLDLASRLAFFLTSRLPDDELLDVAVKNRLSDPQVLEAQVRRLLADPRSKSLVTSFAFQWLKVRAIDNIDPDAVLFPNFDDGLRDAFRREIELFVDSILREDRSVLDLLTADHTFVNERLALHYGIPNVRGDRFRRVTLADSNRWGLLGKGGVLMATSYANRTAPVLRGAWILDNILGTPPAAPPPDVEGFKENKEGEKSRSVREIMEQHRSKPSCNACHGVMDPLGFSLENFDAIGEWRSKDLYAGTPIDASGKLVDGTPVNGPADLRNALMRHPEQFVRTLTEKLMTYALGRSVEYYDMPTVRAIVRDAARDNYRFSSIVMGIVRSPAFQMRKAQGNESESPASSLQPPASTGVQ